MHQQPHNYQNPGQQPRLGEDINNHMASAANMNRVDTPPHSSSRAYEHSANDSNLNSNMVLGA